MLTLWNVLITRRGEEVLALDVTPEPLSWQLLHCYLLMCSQTLYSLACIHKSKFLPCLRQPCRRERGAPAW